MSDKPGRNSPCPCGSGKKFKKCCGFNLSPEPQGIIPIPEEMRTGTKFDFYFEAFQGVLLYLEMLKHQSTFGKILQELSDNFEKQFKPGTENGLPDSFYMNWFALDNRFGIDQRTVVERMMEEKDFQTLPAMVRAAVRELSESYSTCYQARKSGRDTILFEELVTGRRWTVRRIGDSFEDDARPGVIWHARFVGPNTDA